MSAVAGVVPNFLFSTLRLSTPIILAALGGVISERSGVVNIGLEGMMLAGAFGAVVGDYFTHNPYVGVLVGIASGAILALLHAYLSIRLRADQIVSGVAINMLAEGGTNYLLLLLFHTAGNSPEVAQLPWQAFALLAIFLPFLFHLFLYFTPAGLRIRSVGEHPKAADTVGINVLGIRYFCVLLSGMLAGLGGAYLSISHLNSFTRNMSAGKGFIALAAVIFGGWTPLGALGAGLFFGFADALQFAMAGRVNIPSEFLNGLPYILTMVVLIGVIGKAAPPAADGIPYDAKNAR